MLSIIRYDFLVVDTYNTLTRSERLLFKILGRIIDFFLGEPRPSGASRCPLQPRAPASQSARRVRFHRSRKRTIGAPRGGSTGRKKTAEAREAPRVREARGLAMRRGGRRRRTDSRSEAERQRAP